MDHPLASIQNQYFLDLF